jgi:hypothetical protein
MMNVTSELVIVRPKPVWNKPYRVSWKVFEFQSNWVLYEVRDGRLELESQVNIQDPEGAVHVD